MLAKIVNENAGNLGACGVIAFFASKLAPTGCAPPVGGKTNDLALIDYSLMRNAQHARMIRDPLPTYSAKAPLSTLFRPRLNRPTGRCLR